MDTKLWRMPAVACLLAVAAGFCTAAEDESLKAPDMGRSGPVMRDKQLYLCINARKEYAMNGAAEACMASAGGAQAEGCVLPPDEGNEQRALQCLRDFGYLKKTPSRCTGKRPLCPTDTSPVCKAGKWTCQSACMSEPPRCKSGSAVCQAGTWKCAGESGCQGSKPACPNGQIVCDTRCGNGWCSYAWSCQPGLQQDCSGTQPACLFGTPQCQSGAWRCKGPGSPLAPAR
ncbi:MAG: hypothetical protein WC728_14795 [Elusimicrobiota bacterium]